MKFNNKQEINIKHLRLLRICSTILKVYAWFVLVSAVFISIALGFGIVPLMPRWIGFVILGGYSFFFVFFYTIALIADFLITLGSAIKWK
ncbi:MAG: hypothetical protein PHE58_00490 [Candidatus Omnitrophica bacterium]|nr:hypothetical protein [Candidatus Omnitrophota bacterium]